MRYKAVISDLDGTLLQSNYQISDYTKEIISKVIKKGVKFFIATGRHHMDVGHIGKKLGLDTTIITSNGSRVHNEKEEEICAYDIDEEIVQKILDMDFDSDIHVNIHLGDRWFVEKENKWADQFKNEAGFFYEIVDFKTLKIGKASKIFFVCEDHEKLVPVKERIKEIFKEKLNIVFALPECLEILPEGVSKGMAIEKVLKECDIHSDEVVAFGDGLNDLEMLKLVGKGILMGNANDKLKKALKGHEVTQTNDENGVANQLEKLFL